MKKVTEPYLLAFDMDGTLLNSKKKISFKTLHYLRKLTKQGHKIVIASGRPSRAIKAYYEQLNLTTPVICYNGEYIFSPKDPNFKTVIHEIPKEAIIEITEKMKDKIINAMCESDTEIWVDKEDKYLDIFFYYDGMKVHNGELKDILDKNTMTCIFHIPEEYRDNHTKEIEELVRKWPDLTPIFWIGKPYFEIHHLNTTKGEAVKTISEYYKIPRERVIAFGDATNDIEMLQFAKTSVMMSNAKYDIKDKVTMVSLKDNNHDGIYYTLKHIFKNIK